MATTADYLNKLVGQKNALADNLVTKGVTASHDETLKTLVPKVLEINGGGSITPTNYIEDGLVCLFEWNGNAIDTITQTELEFKEDQAEYRFDDVLNRQVGYFNKVAVYSLFNMKNLNNCLTLSCLIKTTYLGKQCGLSIGENTTTIGGMVACGCDESGCASEIKSTQYADTLNYTSSGFAINDGNWHMLTTTRSDKRVTIYVDGEIVGKKYDSVVCNIVTRGIFMGITSGGKLRSTGLYSCNFAIWDRELTAHEVLMNWKYDKLRYNI